MEESLFEQMGGTYRRVGDYYIPNLSLPAEEQHPIGIWGQRNRRYLKENNRVRYMTLLTSGKLVKQTAENGERRIKELDHLIEKIYEDNAPGKLPDERFQRMMQNFEKEQKELIQSVAEVKEVLETAEQKTVDLRLLLRTLSEITELKELTPTIVYSLIRRIEVHNNDKSSGHCHIQVDIYFTAIGLFDIPIEKEMLR